MTLITLGPIINSHIKAQNRARLDAYAKRLNTAGAGISEHQYDTTGLGNIKATSELVFDLPFIYEPQFSYASAIISVPSAFITDPHSTATVRRWVVNSKNAYTGAWLSFRVSSDDSEEIIEDNFDKVKILHFLTFSGVAYKPLDNLDAELSDMTAHTVYF